jgi:hypothetical protein
VQVLYEHRREKIKADYGRRWGWSQVGLPNLGEKRRYPVIFECQAYNSFFSSIIIWGQNGTSFENYLLYLKYKLNWCPILYLAIFPHKGHYLAGKRLQLLYPKY